MSEDQADAIVQRLLGDPTWAMIVMAANTQLSLQGVSSNLALVEELDNLGRSYAAARGATLTFPES